MDNLIIFFLIAIVSWFLWKLADSFHEHWLKNFFKWAWFLFSILRGLLVWFLISQSEVIYVSYIAIIFYWIYKVKFDYSDHAISLIIIITFMNFYSDFFNYIHIFILLWLYIFVDFIKKLQLELLKNFFHNKLQFILIPILYFFYTGNILSFVVIWNLVWSLSVKYFFNIK